jgi:hypothetical protein
MAKELSKAMTDYWLETPCELPKIRPRVLYILSAVNEQLLTRAQNIKQKEIISIILTDLQPRRKEAATMTTNLKTNQRRKIWDIYTESWKAETREEKMELFSMSLATGCRYTDPTAQDEGWEELADNMLGFHTQIPGGHFVTTFFLAHHDKSITKWEMRNSNDEFLGDGISYGEYNSAGKLTSMTGFFETP